MRCSLRFPHKTMFGSSLTPVVCKRAYVLSMIFVFKRKKQTNKQTNKLKKNNNKKKKKEKAICVWMHIKWCPTRWVSYQRQELLVYPSRAHGFTLVFGVILVAHPLSLFVVFLCFVCLLCVSRMLYVANVSRLSIVDCRFGFL